jgi:NAD(P)-dependent dehydrogenase (short-subunit alcohol dehydrogenase family)
VSARGVWDAGRPPVILMTGAGSGLGLETALHLAARGARVYGGVLTGGESLALTAAADARGATVMPLRFDVREPGQVREAVDAVLSSAGRIDAVVQFAGMGLRGFFEDLSLDEIRDVYEVNVFGTMTVTQAVLPHMREARAGRLVFVTSVAGRVGSMSIGGYASSKFAVEGFAECLRQEMAPFGVHVSLVEPGLVFTPHFTSNRNRARRAVDPRSPYYAWFCQHEQMVDAILRSRRITPVDVARTVDRILAGRRPRLRYLVGAGARLVVALRRHVPGEWFERAYWGVVRRLVTRPRRTATGLSEWSEESQTRKEGV